MNFIERFLKQKMKYLDLLIFALALISFSSFASAACVSPTGLAGDIIYNSTENHMQYCNDTQWIDMGVKQDTTEEDVKEFIISISADSVSSCAIGENRKGYCWGSGNTGRLGHNNTANASEPQEVLDGDNTGGTFISLETGGDLSCGVGEDQRAYCFGDDSSGQLGNGATTGNQLVPDLVVNGESNGFFTMISVGLDFACALSTNKKIYCWGNGDSGRLGNGLTSNQTAPVEVHDGENIGGLFKSVTVGFSHACGIGVDNKGYCWGMGANGALGNNSNSDQDEPVEVHNGENTNTEYRAVSAGRNFTCGISVNEKGYCWGTGTSGALGNNSNSDQDEPVEVHNGENTGGTFANISAGWGHSCGIGADQKGYCWGRSTFGLLGNGTTSPNINEPEEVHIGDSPGTFIKISAGNDHACAIGTDHKAYCWGESFSGRVGDGQTTIDRDEPKAVNVGDNTDGKYSYKNITSTTHNETGAALTVRGRGAAPATYTGSMEEMVVSGNYAYLASYADPNNYENGLHVFDINDPDNPTYVGFTFPYQRVISPTNALDDSQSIHINKNNHNFLYLMDHGTCHTMEFQAVDISDPTNPTPTNHVIGDIGESYFIFANALIGNQEGDLIWGVSSHECAVSPTRPAIWAVDVSDPAHPTIAHWYAPPTGTELHDAQWIHVDDGIAVVTFDAAAPKINTYDVSNPNAITLLDSFTHSNILEAREVWHDGQYAYVIEKINDYLLVLDISTPSSISLVASVPIGNQPESLFKKGNYIYTNGQLDDSIEIVDVSDPPNAYVAHVVSDPKLENVDNIYVYGDYIYGGVRGAGGLGVTIVNGLFTDDGNCTVPDGNQGDIIYNDTNHVMQYCNGKNWVSMGPLGDGGAGCSSPNNNEGAMIYNTTHNVMMYCEGDDWVAIGKP